MTITHTLRQKHRFQEAEPVIAAPVATPTTDELRATIRAELQAELAGAQVEADGLFADEIANAPPHLKALVPEELPLAAQVKWLRKAKESGASFVTAVPAVDSRLASNTQPAVDTASLSPLARIAAGYSK
jgi:hypothetical protein